MTTTSDYTLADMRKPAVWSGRMEGLPSHPAEVSPYASVDPRICDPYLLEKDGGLDSESERDRRVLSRSEVHALLQKLRSDIHTLRDSVSSRVDDDDAMYQKIENKYRIKEKRRTAGDYLRRQAQDRGLHRLGSLFNQNIPLFCRLIWVLIVAALLALAAYQLRDRILKFINFRTYSSVQIYQLDSMPFPAVTICNLNPYRLSKAVETGQYHSLQKITQGALPNSSISATDPLGNQSYMNFLKNVSHQREDFILRCQWKDRLCGPANFSLSFTDTGLCYTFRPDISSTKVDRPGPSTGLSLLLNVEQYEYLPGNKRGVGAKVTIHEPGHLTEVNQQGINVPVGKHTAMEIKQIKHMRLQPPLGKCRSVTSADGNSAQLQYTRDLCERRCKTREVISACNCKPPSSPDIHKDLAECDVRQYFSCVVKVNGLTGRNHRECGCEPECDRTEFDIFASHATLASYGEVNWRREFKNLAALEERVRNARDTFQKEDLSIRNHDREQLQSLKESLKDSYIQADSFLRYVKEYDQEHTNASNNLVEAVKQLNKSVLSTYNFFRSTGHTAFDIFVQKLKEALDRISAKAREVYPSKNIQGRPEMMFLPSSRVMLMNLSRLVQTEKQDWSQNLPVVVEIQNGIRSFQDDLLTGYGQNYREFKQSRRFYDIKTTGMLDTTHKLSSFLLKSYWFLGNATDAYRMHNRANANTLYSAFLNTIKEAERSQAKLTEELGELNLKYIESRQGVISLYQTLTSIGANTTTDSASLRKDVKQMKSLAEILKTKVSYLQASMESVVAGYMNNDFNKTAMGHRLKDDKIFKEMNEVESIVRSILSMTNSMQLNGWNLVNPIKPISARLSEFGLMDTSKVRLIFDRLTFSLLSKEVKHLNDEIQTSLSIIRSYQEELSDYTRSNRINEDFYKANLLQVELYFPDLTETRITQRIAYGLFDLACDIGGTFALYLGFSLLTAFDILDFLGAFCKWCAYPSRQ